MKPTENKTYQDLRGDGHIVIYQRDVGSSYYVRMKIIQSDGAYKYKIKSLKTKDQKEAVRRGFEAYEDVSFHIKGGGQLDKRTYRDVFQEWKKSKTDRYSSMSKTDRTIEYVELYSLDYFGQMDFDRITTKDFHKYWSTNKKSEPKPALPVSTFLTEIRR